jgi:hypothetical protein
VRRFKDEEVQWCTFQERTGKHVSDGNSFYMEVPFWAWSLSGVPENGWNGYPPSAVDGWKCWGRQRPARLTAELTRTNGVA